MATYIKVAGELYPAEINGSMGDYTWDGRESKSITLTMSHDEVAALLPDGTPWSIVQRTPAPDENGTENENEWDNSAYSLSGDINPFQFRKDCGKFRFQRLIHSRIALYHHILI